MFKYSAMKIFLSEFACGFITRIGITALAYQTVATCFSLKFRYKLSNLWSEWENQQDATVRCLLSTLSQHVSGIIMPIFRRTKTVCYCIWCNALVLLDVVGSGCGALCCSCAAPHNHYQPHPAEPAQLTTCSRAQLKPDGTRWRTVGEVKGKHASGVGSQ